VVKVKGLFFPVGHSDRGIVCLGNRLGFRKEFHPCRSDEVRSVVAEVFPRCVFDGDEFDPFHGVYLCHVFKVSEMRKKSKDFFRLAQLFFVDAPEVRAKDSLGFDFVSLVFLVGSPNAEVQSDEVGLPEKSVEFSGAIWSFDHG
jgi:hypothetical protein